MSVFFSYKAVSLAVQATEEFLNNLRADIGNENFDRVFLIHPSKELCRAKQNSVANGERFRFFTQSLSASLKEDTRLWTKLKSCLKKRLHKIVTILKSVFGRTDTLDEPTYDLSDKAVNVKDVNNVRAGPYVLASETNRRKKRFIDARRSRQSSIE